MRKTQHIRCQNMQVRNIAREYSRSLSLPEKLQKAPVQILDQGQDALARLARKGGTITIHDNQHLRSSIQRGVEFAQDTIETLKGVGDIAGLREEVEVKRCYPLAARDEDLFLAGEDIIDQSGADARRSEERRVGKECRSRW